ncbi:MAG: NAD(P)-dependent oxidoreductase [Rhodovarius sp.]|nr:NAD(P)-dependent oxidoreductase [Rhodovarius sp.]MDW8313866.1 NAD(P)-dependent oxidoreductase [Rhodovarius sp.]
MPGDRPAHDAEPDHADDALSCLCHLFPPLGLHATAAGCEAASGTLARAAAPAHSGRAVSMHDGRKLERAMARIGIAGIGRMGRAMAERLLEKGHEVTAWNRSPEKVEPLLALGARRAETPRALAEGSEVVLSILTDPAAIEAVYGGEQGILSADLSGRTVVEMSTVRPQVQIELGQRVRAAGGGFVECPVGGTTGPARQGRLIGLLGGEESDIAAVRPVLEDLCRRIEHAGPVGAGAAMKLAINLPLLLFYQAFGEAMTLCRHLGRDPAWLVDLFADSSGGPNVLRTRGPSIALALAGGEPGPVTFDVDLVRKDLRTMLEEARARGAELPLTARALEIYDRAAAESWGSKDAATLAAYWPSKAAAAAATEAGGSR